MRTKIPYPWWGKLSKWRMGDGEEILMTELRSRYAINTRKWIKRTSRDLNKLRISVFRVRFSS